MNSDKKALSRRNALKKIAKGVSFFGMGGVLWGGYLEEAKSSDFALRPPGALDESEFLKACVKCGTCVESCPYDTLKLAVIGDNQPIGTPWFEPRETPCYMCPDIPCVPDCPSGALDMTRVSKIKEGSTISEPDIDSARMGLAIIDTETCLAFWGIQCDACYRACPLINKAITLDYERNERTGKHAFLKPVVHSEICTGCGVCEHSCITEKPAIIILPRDKVTGEVSEHYIKGWDKRDEKRLNNLNEKKAEEKPDGSIEDYLNDLETIIDE